MHIRVYCLFLLVSLISCGNDQPVEDVAEKRTSSEYFYINPDYEGPKLTIDQTPGIKDVLDVFTERSIVPFFGGPKFGSMYVRDVYYNNDALYVVVGGDSSAIHKYVDGAYEKSLYAQSEGSDNRFNNFSSINPLTPGDDAVIQFVIADRSGLQLAIIDSDLTVRRKIPTNLFSSDAFALSNGNFIVENGSELTDNTGRLSLLDSNGKVIKDYFPITPSNSYLNVVRNNILNVAHDGTLNYHGTYNRKVYTLNDTILQLKYIIDYGGKNIPADYMDKAYANIMEFAMPLTNSDYRYDTGNFVETDKWITFAFREKEEVFLAIVDKTSMENVAVVSRWTDSNVLGDFSLENHFAYGPQGVAHGTQQLFWFIAEIPRDPTTYAKILNIDNTPNRPEGRQELLDNWDSEFRFCIMLAK